MAVGGVLAILLPFIALSSTKNYEAKQAKAQTQVKQLDREIAKRQNENKSLEEIASQISEAKTETEALVGVFDKIRPWSAIWQEVGERTPPGVQVSSLSQNGSGSASKLQISGSARSYNDVNDFVLFLQRSPFFNKGMMFFVAASTKEISGSFLSLNGVGTTIRYTSAGMSCVSALRFPDETA